MTSISYRPEIDGLRAFAVVPVILFHMDCDVLAGGYIGVDVFFVISGFLIASIIKKDLDAGSFSFRAFWARRVRRIFPALLVVIVASLAACQLMVFRPDQPVINAQAVSALMSVANVYLWLSTGDYWGPRAEDSPFLHTWSLSVEEQFYIFLPLLFWLVYSARAKHLQNCILAIASISYIVFLYGVSAHPAATFFLLPSRIWELAAGVLLAVMPLPVKDYDRADASHAPLATAGLIMVLASYFFVPNLSSGLVMAVLGVGLIIAFGHSGLCYRLLSQAPFVYVGKLSYSLYLWHWPVVVFSDYKGFNGSKLWLILTIVPLSLLSYYGVERPTRHRANVVAPIILSWMLTLAVSTWLAIQPPQLYDTSAYATPHWQGIYYDLKPRLDLTNIRAMIANTEVPDMRAPADAFKNGGIIPGSGSAHPEVVILGDSHGVMWSEALREVVESANLKASFWSMGGVSPFLEFPIKRNQSVNFLTSQEKHSYDESRINAIRTWKPRVVIVCSRWSTYLESETVDLIDFLSAHCGQVLLMEQPPELAVVGDRNALQYICFLQMTPEAGVRKYFTAGNLVKNAKGRALIRKIASKYGNCDIIPTHDVFAQGSEALILDGNQVTYLDDDHLTTYGTRLAIPQIQSAVAKLQKSTD